MRKKLNVADIMTKKIDHILHPHASIEEGH